MTLADTDFPIVHALALRKRSDLDGLVRATGLEPAAIEAALSRAVESKLVLAARGSWVVTPDGDRELRASYGARYAQERADAELVAAYDRFEKVNRDVKAIVTQWQTRSIGGSSVPNDHTDEAYDARVLDRLGEAHERAQQVISALASRVPRLARYSERLATALDRAEGDEPDAVQWVSGVRCDSYHTVWFELHEDLLRMLDRKREES